MTNCKICEKEASFAFETLVLGKFPVNFYKCPSCGFLFCENVHWKGKLAEKIADLNYFKRNIQTWQICVNVLNDFFDCGANFLDLSGQYGIFARLLRDCGLNFYFEGEENLFATGAYAPENTEIELITCLESFSRFEFPLYETERMLQISKNILFNTPITDKNLSQCQFERGENVSFYTKKTLKYIAKKFGLKLVSSGGFHLLTEYNINNIEFSLKMQGYKMHNALVAKLLYKTAH